MSAASLLGFFAPGPIEILIILVVLMLLVGVPVVAVVIALVAASRSRHTGPQGGQPFAGYRRCPHCGQPLGQVGSPGPQTPAQTGSGPNQPPSQ